MNKQRITKLSRREVEAHRATGGAWGPGIVPKTETINVLGIHGITDDAAEAIVAEVIDPLGRYRMDENFRGARLSRAELIKQARDTAAVALELYTRVQNMDPFIRAWADSDSFRAWGEIAFPESGEQYLLRLHALMNAASAKASSLPSKVPKRTGNRDVLLALTAEVVRKHSAKMTKRKAGEVAAELLECWGVNSPKDDNKVRKAIRRAK